MTKEQENRCHAIIHTASSAAAVAGAGLAQIPSSDSIAIVPIQVAMIISLGSAFGMELTKSAARATLASATATLIGRGISQLLLGWIPIFGNVLNATTAAGVTETIGWAVARDFDNQSSKQGSNKK